jgi:hypothetical protein
MGIIPSAHRAMVFWKVGRVFCALYLAAWLILQGGAEAASLRWVDDYYNIYIYILLLLLIIIILISNKKKKKNTNDLFYISI